MQKHRRQQSRGELPHPAPLTALRQINAHERSNRRHTAVHHGCAETAQDPDAEVPPLQRLEVRNVLDQGESGANGESANGRVDHERYPRRGDQESPESPLGQLLDYGCAKVDVAILVLMELPKNNCVNSVANRSRYHACRKRTGDHFQRYKLIAVQNAQRSQKQQHWQQCQGYPQAFIYPHRIRNVKRFQPESRRYVRELASAFTKTRPHPPIGKLSKFRVEGAREAVNGSNSTP